MPPKLLHSPKTRRQRASFSRQLRSRASAGSSGPSASSKATQKKKAPALKKSGPLCKTCTTAARAVHHHWKQCPNQKERASAPVKAPKSRKSTRTLETDARQVTLLAELDETTRKLLDRDDDAMSVDSEDTTSQEPARARELSISLGARSDTSDNDDASAVAEAREEDDVSMAASDTGGSRESSTEEDGSPRREAGALPEFFSDDEVSDSEPAREAARVRAAARDASVSSADQTSDESDESTGTSDDDSTQGGEAAQARDDAEDDDAQSTDASEAHESDTQSSDGEEAEDHAMQTSGRSDNEEAEHAHRAEVDEDEEESDDEDAANEDDDAGDADDEDEGVAGPIDQTAGTYFNQAAHVGLIESDDDIDSETRVLKLRKTVEDEADLRRLEMQRALDHPSPEKVKEQEALLAELQGAAPGPDVDAADALPAPKDDAVDAQRRAALRVMLSKTVEQRQVDEAATGGSAVISNGWKGNSAAGESITYKRNTPQRWSRVNKTHKTVKHDFKPMMQSMVQKGEYLADCLGASVMIIAMPKGGLGNAHTWHSDQIEVDAPGLPQAMRDLWFQELAGARQQHVSEMAASLETLRAEQKQMQDQLVELNRENQKLKKRLIKESEEHRAQRKSRY